MKAGDEFWCDGSRIRSASLFFLSNPLTGSIINVVVVFFVTLLPCRKIVNQDTLGSRLLCERRARELLQQGARVVIDRWVNVITLNCRTVQ